MLVKKIYIIFFIFISYEMGMCQNYTSYFTGNPVDKETSPSGGICLMGGASEDDNAMKWFLERVNGGDVLVLRASGSDGYNDYLYKSLGVNVNSVESIVCHQANSAKETYIHQKIQQAEAIWFAGGDQWKYVSYWRNTAIDSLINLAVQNKKIVIGGTSAGMAILGQYYFSAANGTVSSSVSLSNPFDNRITVDSNAFVRNEMLKNTITDTHFDNPDRKGRLVTFLARIYKDYGAFARAIACDEFTAVCIDQEGIAKVFGSSSSDDNAYFIQANCALLNKEAEQCSPSQALTWDKNGEALKVYKVKGNSSGSNTFPLKTWTNGNGGQWLNWSVKNGSFMEQNGNALHCNTTFIAEKKIEDLSITPNPTKDKIIIDFEYAVEKQFTIQLFNIMGQALNTSLNRGLHQIEVDLTEFPTGLYVLKINSEYREYRKIICKN